MPIKTKKETIEYDVNFLDDWNHFCDNKGYSKRHAAHAARLAFMGLNAEQREQDMEAATPLVIRKRKPKDAVVSHDP